jgi:hypothetical protein
VPTPPQHQTWSILPHNSDTSTILDTPVSFPGQHQSQKVSYFSNDTQSQREFLQKKEKNKHQQLKTPATFFFI